MSYNIVSDNERKREEYTDLSFRDVRRVMANWALYITNNTEGFRTYGYLIVDHETAEVLFRVTKKGNIEIIG